MSMLWFLFNISVFGLVWWTMVKYPKQFKEFVVDHYVNSDDSIRSTADHFGIPESTVRSWINRLIDNGSLAPLKELIGFESRGRDRVMTRNDFDICIRIIAENPECYYDEINDLLYYETNGDCQVHDSTVRRAILDAGLTRKRISKFRSPMCKNGS